MSVIIGSARSSYGNTTRGDQHGGDEVSTQSWYRHSLGWVVLRAKSADKRAKLAKAMKAACENNNIGYSQPDRLALFNLVKDKGYDPSKANKATNCDCSSLVRVCCYFAGIKPSNFITSSEASALMATGEFEKLTDSKYTTKSDYLCAGDILVTKSKGHTVICITSGPKCDVKAEEEKYQLGDRTLFNFTEGEDVKELQRKLIDLGYSCGDWGIDGEFGDCTEQAVEEFQKSVGLPVSGIADKETIAKIEEVIASKSEESNKVEIHGGNCYVRSEPNTSSQKLGVATKGSVYFYAGSTSIDGWHKIVYKGQEGWVSGKYAVRT